MQRRRWTRSMILILLLTVQLCLPAHPFAAMAETIQPHAGPNLVYTAQDLYDVRYNLSGDYLQMAHIDLGVSPWIDGGGWDPIGTDGNPFTGTYDGNGFTISNLTINRWETNVVGLFGLTSSDAEEQLKNIDLSNVNVTGDWNVGGLVGYAYGPIDNCSVSGTVVGGNIVGGLAGISENNIRNCTTDVSVRSLDSGAGGLVGVQQEASITDCSTTGSVLTDYYGGGIAGECRGNILRSHSSVTVTGLRDVGGLVGNAPESMTEINACSASGTVISSAAADSNSYAGGLAGRASNRIMNSYTTNNVSGQLSVGGLVGILDIGGYVTRCSSSGIISGQNFVGGMIGYLNGSSIHFSYSSSSVTGTAYVGGLVGLQDPVMSSTTIANCTAYGHVEATGFSGGLVGRSYGSKTTSRILNSWAYGSASGNNYVGGLVGYAEGLIKNCQAQGAVHGANAGGLVGTLSEYGLIQACHATGNVTGASTLGGLVGDASAAVSCSSAKGSVTASDNGTVTPQNNYAGGLIGRTRTKATIVSSHAAGSVLGYAYVGGLVGESYGDIWNSYALGSAEGHSYVGGLCGVTWGAETILKDINNCFSAGEVTGSPSGSYIGGLIGHMATDVRLTYSYYDSTTSGQSDVGKGEPRTTAALQSGVPDGTIFTNWSAAVWQFDPDNEYPWQLYNKPLRIHVDRLAGSNRYTTAVSVSQMGWGDCVEGSDTVILSVGTNFPDSLAGVPLSFSLNAPILLTTRDTLPTSTRDEIQRLGASEVIILGGTGAISEAVAGQVNSIPGVTNIRRIAGSNRYETARLIAMEDALDGYDVLYLASGADFPDALSAASYAAQRGRPILLTGKTALSSSVKTLLDSKPEIRLVVVVGGTAAISEDVVAELHGLGITTQRIFGANRYETSLNLANSAWQNGQEIYLATGTNFPDALAGGVLAALNRGGVVLVRSTATTVPDSIIDFIDSHSITSGRILGGLSAVSGEMEFSLSTLLTQ